MNKIFILLMIISMLSCINLKDKDDEETPDFGSFNYLKGKTFSVTCYDIIGDGSLYVDLSVEFDNSHRATSEFMIYSSSACDNASRLQRLQSVTDFVEGTEGLSDIETDEELEGSIAGDSTEVSAYITAYTTDAASTLESEDCDGDGMDFTNNLGVALDVSGKCGELAVGALEYSIFRIDRRESPAILNFGTDKDGDDHDGTTPELRFRNFVEIPLEEQ